MKTGRRQFRTVGSLLIVLRVHSVTMQFDEIPVGEPFAHLTYAQHIE